MSRGLIFWVIMLLLLLSLFAGYGGFGGPYIRSASGVIEWVLLALLGWQVYGPMVRA